MEKCGQQGKGRDCPLQSALLRARPECCVLFWASQFRKGREMLQQVQRRAVKLEHESWELLRELGCSAWQKGGSGDTFIVLWNHLKGGCSQAGLVSYPR